MFYSKINSEITKYLSKWFPTGCCENASKRPGEEMRQRD